MAEVQSDQQDSGKGKHKKVRAKKSSTHIDMTPMVDLAFLLLTFFMLTTTFSKPKAMELVMPVKDKDKPDSMIVKHAITLLLGDKNRIFWYYGELKPETQLEETDYSAKGIREVLLDHNKPANAGIISLNEERSKVQMADSTYNKRRREVLTKKSLFAVIKTDDKAKYGNVINALDECNITNVGKYALVDITPVELKLLQEKYVK